MARIIRVAPVAVNPPSVIFRPSIKCLCGAFVVLQKAARWRLCFCADQSHAGAKPGLAKRSLRSSAVICFISSSVKRSSCAARLAARFSRLVEKGSRLSPVAAARRGRSVPGWRWCLRSRCPRSDLCAHHLIHAFPMGRVCTLRPSLPDERVEVRPSTEAVIALT